MKQGDSISVDEGPCKESMKLTVVVLDALDELGCESSQLAHRRILMKTIASWSCLPSAFKLLITCRDVPFQLACNQITLETGDFVSPEATIDIQIFFKQRFTKIAVSCPSLPPHWPGTSIIKQLTNHAAGLFIWAETVV